jgi:hypothetical protein
MFDFYFYKFQEYQFLETQSTFWKMYYWYYLKYRNSISVEKYEILCVFTYTEFGLPYFDFFPEYFKNCTITLYI